MRIERDAGRVLQQGLRSQAAIALGVCAAGARHSGAAGECRDIPAAIDLANDVVSGVRDEQVAAQIDSDTGRRIEQRSRRHPTVTGIARWRGAGKGLYVA